MAKKSMAVGGGGRFAKLKGSLEAKGMSAESAAAVSASIGMKKYGKKRMESMSAKGKVRAAQKKAGK